MLVEENTCRDRRISTFLFFLLLGIEQISTCTAFTKTGIYDFQNTVTNTVLRSYCLDSRIKSCCEHRRPQSFQNRYWDNSFTMVLASSFSIDDSQSDKFEHPTESDRLEDDGVRYDKTSERKRNDGSGVPSVVRRMFDEIPFIHLFFSEGRKKLPPVQVDDFGVMLYDIFLIVNLSLSISLWVTHRLDFEFIPYAFNEGCLFSILWIAAGLYHGSFLYSAMDGHYPLDDEEGRGGPKAAAALAFNTYINAINLRLISALLGAWIQHRKVGEGSPMEELLPLEIGCGLVLMTMWRALHSQVTPRIR